jgi:purine nucleosidase/pyrimidine-specific ribonucleoside hydrolase
MATPILLDCDPGHDDAVAILLAAAHDEIDLRAITTVAGNCSLELATLNARRVAALAGLEGVPIAAGAAGPIAGGELVTAPDIHGLSGLDGYDVVTGEAPLDPRPALEVMIEVLESADEPVTLVPTGPLTNVAGLLAARPDLGSRIREIVFMGGSTHRGNTTPAAEFNIFVDPEAAEMVLASGLPITMIGLNLTHQALATPEVLGRIEALPGEPARAVAAWLRFFGGTYERVHGEFAPPVHDPCTVALLIDPRLMRCVDTFVAVETAGRWTRGATIVDLQARHGQPANARVALELDAPRFWELVIGALERLP